MCNGTPFTVEKILPLSVLFANRISIKNKIKRHNVFQLFIYEFYFPYVPPTGGWSCGAKVLGNLSVPGRSTYLENRARARAC